jgi:hypothetical protein
MLLVMALVSIVIMAAEIHDERGRRKKAESDAAHWRKIALDYERAVRDYGQAKKDASNVEP